VHTHIHKLAIILQCVEPITRSQAEVNVQNLLSNYDKSALVSTLHYVTVPQVCYSMQQHNSHFALIIHVDTVIDTVMVATASITSEHGYHSVVFARCAHV